MARRASGARPFYFAYFGFFDPRSVGIDYQLPGPKEWLKRPGYYACSVSLLRGYHFPVPDGKGTWVLRNDEQLPSRLCSRRVGGYSIVGVSRVKSPQVKEQRHEATHLDRRHWNFSSMPGSCRQTSWLAQGQDRRCRSWSRR